MNRIYLAARFGRKEELKKYREELQMVDANRHPPWYVVTSTWLDCEWQDNGQGGSSVAPEGHRSNMAIKDREDLWNADIVISFTESPDDCNGKRGGRHVEFGMAIAYNKRCIVVGPRENVFHHLPGVEVYSSWEEAKQAL